MNDTEQQIQARCEEGAWEDATRLALEAYGPQILRYLMGALRDEDAAQECFSMFSEQLWAGIEGFEWRSSMRTWAFALARGAMGRYRRRLSKARQGRTVHLSECPERLLLYQQEVRTRTLTFLRSEIKRDVDNLRALLDPEDRELLALRLDQNLPFKEIARIVLGPKLDGMDELEVNNALHRESARLRQYYRTGLRNRLKKLAREGVEALVILDRLRIELPHQADRELIYLRLSDRLSWPQIHQQMAHEEMPRTEEELRTHFRGELVVQLRMLAEEQGVLSKVEALLGRIQRGELYNPTA